MPKIFGGFSPDFYEYYQQEYPLAEGYERRENIYKLYHLLNHANMFGSSYFQDVRNILHFYQGHER
jgi:protein-ribulosamine 3-kinase